MTEREKYRSRGVLLSSASPATTKKAIKNYQTLVSLYPADNTGYANLALALYLRPQSPAWRSKWAGKAIDIYPRDILQRTNYATYSMYGGRLQHRGRPRRNGC